VIVDVLPDSGRRVQSMSEEQRGAVSLIAGPVVYDSFDAMLRAVAAAVPGRPIESLRTGLLHNAKRLEDGRWTWRYDRIRREGDERPIDFGALWEDLAAVEAPLMLVRGARSAFVHDDDEARLRELKPTARIESVVGAGHSVQSDRPVVLAQLIVDFLTTTP